MNKITRVRKGVVKALANGNHYIILLPSQDKEPRGLAFVVCRYFIYFLVIIIFFSHKEAVFKILNITLRSPLEGAVCLFFFHGMNGNQWKGSWSVNILLALCSLTHFTIILTSTIPRRWPGAQWIFRWESYTNPLVISTWSIIHPSSSHSQFCLF